MSDTPADTSTSRIPPGLRRDLLILVFLAAIFSFAGLGSKSLWVDEAKGLNDAATSIRGIIHYCQTRHQAPLREILLHVLVHAPREYRDWLTRVPSALAATALIPLMFLLGRFLFGKGAGWCAAIFLLLHPWHLLHAQDGRMHAVILLFGAIALFLHFRLLRERGSRWWAWALWGGVMAVAAYFSYLAVLPGIALAGATAWAMLRAFLRRESREEGGRLLRGALIAGAAFFVLYAPWLFFGVLTIEHYRIWFGHWIPRTEAVAPLLPGNGVAESGEVLPEVSAPVPASDLPAFEKPFTTHYNREYFIGLLQDLGGQNRISALLAGILALIGLAALVRHHRDAVPVVICWFAAPWPLLALLSIGAYFPSRYLLYLLAMFALLVGYGGFISFAFFRRVLLARRSLSPAFANILAGAIAMGFLLAIQVGQIANYYRSEKQNWRDAVRYLEANKPSRDILITGDHWAFYGVLAYVEKPLNLAPALDQFMLALDAEPRSWYIYWAPLPDFIQQVVDERMELVIVFPGLLGDIKIMREI